ncbi:PDR/VanB family oxidoreductase [Actinospica sp.]|jgi:ferredoxin-NADP reductase|uniref:PDR/VanB family oxidoreductase n=1 Tax=Actinospica sp. TaxID=1872142 RepID=UPI002CBCF27A|nr:PDR/VanB family oxidoreductase [Actinospica sp.]HWG28524.1 PDR/VanB family oxidoreductase [Actinospica sp.]
MPRPAPTSPPPDLYGRGPDRFLRGFTAFNNLYLNVLGRVPWSGEARRTGFTNTAWRKMRVVEREDAADDAVTFHFAAPDGRVLEHWWPGAHLRIELPSGLVRHYSLCGDPARRDTYTITVRRIPGGAGSVELHDAVRQGSMIRVMKPRNAFPFAAERTVLFLAGGIGITPILPMVREAAARRLDWRLVYAGRSRAAMPFLDVLKDLGGDRVQILADDETGRVPDGSELVGAGARGSAVYCCGPAPMLAAARTAAQAVGPDAVSAFHFERFTPPPIVDGRAFELELARSGVVLPVPADRSALDVLREHDPAGTPYSCRQGFCGVCKQSVTTGRVEHRDLRLTDDERAAGEMLVCVSRAPEGERLVIDR